MVDSDLSTSCFADATRLPVVAVAVGVITVAAGTSTFPADRPLAALVVAAVATVGAMDGRAACSIPKPPASCSLSLRFSLRACDFEYGARDASKPVCVWCGSPPAPHPHPYTIQFVFDMDGPWDERHVSIAARVWPPKYEIK